MKSSVLGSGPSLGKGEEGGGGGEASRAGAGGDGGAEPVENGVATPCANLRCANTLRFFSSGDSGEGALGRRAATVSRLERGIATLSDGTESPPTIRCPHRDGTSRDDDKKVSILSGLVSC